MIEHLASDQKLKHLALLVAELARELRDGVYHSEHGDTSEAGSLLSTKLTEIANEANDIGMGK